MTPAAMAKADATLSEFLNPYRGMRMMALFWERASSDRPYSSLPSMRVKEGGNTKSKTEGAFGSVSRAMRGWEGR